MFIVFVYVVVSVIVAMAAIALMVAGALLALAAVIVVGVAKGVAFLWREHERGRRVRRRYVSDATIEQLLPPPVVRSAHDRSAAGAWHRGSDGYSDG